MKGWERKPLSFSTKAHGDLPPGSTVGMGKTDAPNSEGNGGQNARNQQVWSGVKGFSKKVFVRERKKGKSRRQFGKKGEGEGVEAVGKKYFETF